MRSSRTPLYYKRGAGKWTRKSENPARSPSPAAIGTLSANYGRHLAMNHTAAITYTQLLALWPMLLVLLLLLLGPVTIRAIEHNLELFMLAIGILAGALSGTLRADVMRSALSQPSVIAIAVLLAGVIFRETREALDRAFVAMRSRMRRPLLTALTIFVLAMLSSLITSIIAALVLAEIIGMLNLHEGPREKVVVAGCFAIGLGSALTPAGGPVSTLAAHALDLGFFGLFALLALWVIPGVLAMAILAGYFARGEYSDGPPGAHVRETFSDIIVQAAKVYGFIAGLVLIGEAYAPIARQVVPMLNAGALYWANTISALLDNATLLALEVRAMPAATARDIMLALLISGGMLIPGNIPNVIAAGALTIKSGTWARIAIPIGLVLLGIYFAFLQLLKIAS
jgi:predicted cation transporter